MATEPLSHHELDTESDTAEWHQCAPRSGCLCAGEVPERLLRLEAAWAELADEFVCISLRDRPDRVQESSEQFHQFGLCRLVRFYRPDRPSMNHIHQLGIKFPARYGCWHSHQSVCRHFFQNGISRIGGTPRRLLVFEDDVQFIKEYATVAGIQRAAAAITGLPQSWEMFYLGCFPYCGYPLLSSWQGLCNSVFRCFACQTHAYVVSERGATTLLKSDYIKAKKQNGGRESGIDNWISFHMEQYARIPQLAVQSASKSDIRGSGRWLDDVFLPFGLRMLREHSFAVEVGAYAALPVACLLVCILLLRHRLVGLILFAVLIMLLVLVPHCFAPCEIPNKTH